MFKEIYYWIYQFHLVLNDKRSEAAEFASIGILCFIEIFNIASIGILIKHILGVIKIPINLNYAFAISIVIYSFLFYLNYIFIYKKRHQIFERNKSISKGRKMRGILMTAFYILFSIFLPVTLSDRWETIKTQEVQRIDDIMSLQVVYDQFLKTNDYKYMRQYYEGINKLIENNPDQNGFIQIRDSLEKNYGDSLLINH